MRQSMTSSGHNAAASMSGRKEGEPVDGEIPAPQQQQRVPQQEGSGTSLNLAAWACDPPLLGTSHLKASRSADPVRCRSEVQSGANQPADRRSYARLSLGPFSAIRINWA